MKAGLKDCLERIYPDSQINAGEDHAALHVARGSTVAVHVLIQNVPAGMPVRFSVQGNALGKARWRRLIDVPVEVNTGLASFTEKVPGENPYVVRRAPFRTYDAISPTRSPMPSTGDPIALRLEIDVPRSVRPGPREFTLDIRGTEERFCLRLAVTVHKAVIPETGKDSLPYTNWFSIPLIAQRHELKPWSSAHWKMIERYARLMVRARQNTFWVNWGDVFARTSAGLVLNRPRLHRLVQIFTRAGMHWIEGGHVAGRLSGEWKVPRFNLVQGGPLATSPEGNADLAKACGQLMEEINRHGWRDRWIQHCTDEPIAENAVDYRILVGMLRKYMPGLPILDATMNTDLAGSVDIWCPQAQEYQKHRETFEAQRALGDRVWFYTCCFPGGPWLNRLLDQELLRPLLFGWAAARFDLDGFLHWGLNHYSKDQDPFAKSVVGHTGGNCLPAGDTHVVYPGRGEPWPSLRLEAQREGFEDYELLRLLKAKRGAAARKVIARALRGFDDFVRDVAEFRAAQQKLLEALD